MLGVETEASGIVLQFIYFTIPLLYFQCITIEEEKVKPKIKIFFGVKKMNLKNKPLN